MAGRILPPGHSRIIIIEGIAGSGKDTFQKNLAEHSAKGGFIVYSFSEEELLFSWKHYWINNMESHRIRFLHSLLDYCEELIENPKVVVILNRFHITYAIFSKFEKKAKKLYDRLVWRLSNLPVQIFVGKLSEENIGKRALHPERNDIVWRMHQDKRLQVSGFGTLTELYKEEQKTIFTIAEKQGIPYSIFYL